MNTHFRTADKVDPPEVSLMKANATDKASSKYNLQNILLLSVLEVAGAITEFILRIAIIT